MPRSIFACRTQPCRTDSTRSRSRATCAAVWRSFSTRRTALALNSSVNLRRARRFFCSSMDTIYSFRVVSTKAGQDHSECNECNEALKMARDAVAMARRLALVAENALVNGDLRRVRSVLRDLQDMTFAPLARRPGWSAELR